ncbi:MAG: beta-propeller fold lactonase family protein [Bryobacteraceae bacterium]
MFAAGCEGFHGYRIYVTNETSGDLSIIDSESLAVVATVPLGKRPRGIRASPDRKTIYVALSGSPIAGPGVDESTLPPPDKSADGIGVFDVAEQKLVRVIKSGSDPEAFDISKDGRLLYVSNEDASGVSILDIAAGRVLQTLPTGGEPEGVMVSPDGKFVYVTSEEAGTITVVDTAAAKVVKTFKVGRRPRTIAITPDGLRAYANAENDGNVVVIDAVKHEATRTISLGQPGVIKPMSVLLSRDASKLYVSTGRGRKVTIVNTADDRIEASIEVGQRPWGIALAPDGKTLYTANGPSNDISAVNLKVER